MKLKATISLPGEHFSPSERFSLAQMVIATNSDELHQEVYEEVLRKHLRVGEFGPAEYFTQMSDRMTRVREGNLIGFDVTLSGVSVNARRAQMDFWEGLDKLDEIYRQIAAEHLVPELSAQVFTRMALDTPIGYLDRTGNTPLLEKGPTLVGGSSQKRETAEDEITLAEAEALLGDRRTVEAILTSARFGNLERGR